MLQLSFITADTASETKAEPKGTDVPKNLADKNSTNVFDLLNLKFKDLKLFKTPSFLQPITELVDLVRTGLSDTIIKPVSATKSVVKELYKKILEAEKKELYNDLTNRITNLFKWPSLNKKN